MSAILVALSKGSKEKVFGEKKTRQQKERKKKKKKDVERFDARVSSLSYGHAIYIAPNVYPTIPILTG